MQRPDDALRDHFPMLWRFFRARADHDIDDLIQQTLVLYLESAAKVGPILHPRAYVLRIARSVLFAHYRRRGTFDPLTHTVRDANCGLSTALANRERDDRIRDALEQLPYALFEAIDLYYGEQLRGPDLAAALGVPEGTVRSRLRRAKDQLRAACGDDLAAQVSSFTSDRVIETRPTRPYAGR